MFSNKASLYAILSVVEIAKRLAAGHKGGVQAGEIAKEFGLPEAYAAKVMSQLARSRILRSDRGPRGGFQLSRDAKHISFLEILEAVNGSIDGRADAEQCGAPEHITAGLSEIFGKATDQTRDVLAKATVSAFVEEFATAKAGK
jgi:Rrf2 family iron-sulfur cluster assembly transcriptional regulator